MSSLCAECEAKHGAHFDECTLAGRNEELSNALAVVAAECKHLRERHQDLLETGTRQQLRIQEMVSAGLNAGQSEEDRKQLRTLELLVPELRAHAARHEGYVIDLTRERDRLRTDLHEAQKALHTLARAAQKKHGEVESARDALEADKDAIIQKLTKAGERLAQIALLAKPDV